MARRFGDLEKIEGKVVSQCLTCKNTPKHTVDSSCLHTVSDSNALSVDALSHLLYTDQPVAEAHTQSVIV